MRKQVKERPPMFRSEQTDYKRRNCYPDEHQADCKSDIPADPANRIPFPSEKIADANMWPAAIRRLSPAGIAWRSLMFSLAAPQRAAQHQRLIWRATRRQGLLCATRALSNAWNVRQLPGM